jgi:hypothetical protein
MKSRWMFSGFCAGLGMDLRGGPSYTRRTHRFEIPCPQSTQTDQRHPDKAHLRETIRMLRAAGWSYREIGRELGLHWTRVSQIVKDANRKTE